jgi:hypothetical protein
MAKGVMIERHASKQERGKKTGPSKERGIDKRIAVTADYYGLPFWKTLFDVTGIGPPTAFQNVFASLSRMGLYFS